MKIFIVMMKFMFVLCSVIAFQVHADPAVDKGNSSYCIYVGSSDDPYVQKKYCFEGKNLVAVCDVYFDGSEDCNDV